MNQFKVFILLTVLTLMFVFLGDLVGGTEGAIFFFVIAAIMNFGAYWFSDALVLRMSGAREVAPGTAPWLEDSLARLSQNAGIPVPRLFIIDQPTPNAFATGRNPNKGVVAVTTGLLQALSRDEVEGVVAHELSHIRHRDTLLMAVVATLAGAISMIANSLRWGLMFGGYGYGDRDGDRGNPFAALLVSMLMALGAVLIQMAISRSREFKADAGAAAISHNPRALANALRRIEASASRYPFPFNPAVGALMIHEPKQSMGTSLLNLFSTHPPVEERVRRLEEIAASGTIPVG